MPKVNGVDASEYRNLPEVKEQKAPNSIGRPKLHKRLFRVVAVRSISRSMRADTAEEAKELFLVRSSESFYNGGITVEEVI